VQLGIGSRNGGPLQLFAQGGGPSGSWTLSSHLLTSAGEPASSAQISAFLHAHCANVGLPPTGPGAGNGLPQHGGGGADADAARACLHQVVQTFRIAVTYEPADRYWPLQWLEAGVFIVLALAAAIGCYAWVTRRAT
jgi:hypothetical protein